MFRSGYWHGWYIQLGGKHENSAQIEFVDGKVKGYGHDEVGTFAIDGDYNPKTLSAEWLKIYTGSHGVRYTGTLTGDVLQGTWKIADPRCGANGTFELTAPALTVAK